MRKRQTAPSRGRPAGGGPALPLPPWRNPEKKRDIMRRENGDVNGIHGIGHITQERETQQLRLGARGCGVGHIETGVGFRGYPM